MDRKERKALVNRVRTAEIPKKLYILPRAELLRNAEDIQKLLFEYVVCSGRILYVALIDQFQSQNENNPFIGARAGTREEDRYYGLGPNESFRACYFNNAMVRKLEGGESRLANDLEVVQYQMALPRFWRPGYFKLTDELDSIATKVASSFDKAINGWPDEPGWLERGYPHISNVVVCSPDLTREVELAGQDLGAQVVIYKRKPVSKAYTILHNPKPL